MSQELQSEQFALPQGQPAETSSTAGHDAVRFEEKDTNVRMVVVSLGIVGVMLLATLVITIVVQQYLKVTNPRGDLPSPLSPARIIPPGPLLDVHPAETYPLVRQHEDQILNSYGSDGAGHFRIPIDSAMNAVVSRLPVRPNAPIGMTTPGGLDRRYSGSLGEMPNAERKTEIKGEISKRAQP